MAIRRMLLCLCMTVASVEAITYEYDSAGRVTKAMNDDGTVVNYTYDSAGNLLGTTSTGAANGLGAAYEIIP